VLLELAKRVAESQGTSVSMPSGMVPPYEKPNSRRRGKKPGAKSGHQGRHRQVSALQKVRRAARSGRLARRDARPPGSSALTAWLHYGLGITIFHIVEVLNHHLQFKVTQGGLVAAWQRLAEILFVWYETIGSVTKQSGVLHTDETGWRSA